MGRDKALLEFEPGGPSLLERTIERVAAVALKPFIVAPLERSYERFGVAVIPDAFPGGGALGGIATGLARIGTEEDLLVVGCDHPFLNVELMRYMANVDGQYDALVPRTRGASRQGGELILQTLHAIYRPSCLPALDATLARGYSSSKAFFSQICVRPIDEPELRKLDPDLRSLLSVNTPEALDAARRIAGQGDPVDYTLVSDPPVE